MNCIKHNIWLLPAASPVTETFINVLVSSFMFAFVTKKCFRQTHIFVVIAEYMRGHTVFSILNLFFSWTWKSIKTCFFFFVFKTSVPVGAILAKPPLFSALSTYYTLTLTISIIWSKKLRLGIRCPNIFHLWFSIVSY